MVRVTIANSSLETGALLVKMLQGRGIYDSKATPIVCYGSPVAVHPCLNGNCGTDKIERLMRMTKAKVSTVPWFRGTTIPSGMKFPLLGRKATGFGGTDIVPVFQAQEVAWRVKAGWDWFSSFVPVAKEFRVWIYRGIHLDTYEKEMKRPEDFKYVGRNFRNGFDFKLGVEHKEATYQAILSLDTLKLDFGAVDMLLGEDGRIYVLEVNTAPGVLKSKAEGTLAKLADHIVEWDRNGYQD